MKRLILPFFCLFSLHSTAQRYLSEIFEEVQVDTNVIYGENVNILTQSDPDIQMPTIQSLKMDVYQPAEDDDTNRPLIINIHDGSFLPAVLNFQTTGTKTDSLQVTAAIRLAKMGYVVANIDYRLGWNPFAASYCDYIGTLSQAIYRGMQDVRTAVRFFRKDIDTNENSFGICGENIVVMGNGFSGGMTTLFTATIDSPDDFLIPALFCDQSQNFVINPLEIGDINATSLGINSITGDTLCVPNHVGYSSEISMAVNMSGVIFTRDWIDATDPPLVSFHVPTDPHMPIDSSVLIPPNADPFIFPAFGSRAIQAEMATLGNNESFIAANIVDDFTTNASAMNGGLEGLYPVHRPCLESMLPGGGLVCESNPWEWWNGDYWSSIEHPFCFGTNLPLEECNYHLINGDANQDMSAEKGRVYLDTIIGYSAPRMYAVMQLESNCFTNTSDRINEQEINLSIAPNPSNETMVFSSEEQMLSIEIYNLSGNLMHSEQAKNNQIILKKENFNKGIFFAKIQLANGSITRKIMFQ